MTNAILSGKPDAGNPHVRFDEGEVASAKPRRGSLLYKKLLIGFSVLGVAFAASAEWTWTKDLLVGPSETVLLSTSGEGYHYSGVPNSSMTVRGTLLLKGDSDSVKYNQAFEGTSPKISIGPEPGDNGLLQVTKAVINNDQVQVVVGENGGRGRIGFDQSSWPNSSINVKTFELSENAVTTEEVFDVLAIGHSSPFVVTTVKNGNVKPMRISFISKSEGNQYRGRLGARNQGSIFAIPKGDIILTGTRYAPIFLLSRWSWGYQLVKPETASSATGGFLEFASTDGSACDVLFDCCSDGVNANESLTLNYNKIRWKNKGDVYFFSTFDGRWNWPGQNEIVCASGGRARLSVANALPYGKNTGAVIVHGTTLDLMGNGQKVNSVIVQSAAVFSGGTSVGKLANSGSKTTVTVGEGGVNGVLAGNLVPVSGEVEFVKVDGGTLVLSNATIKTLVVNGGSVRPAPGTVSTVESISVNGADLFLKCLGDGRIDCDDIVRGEGAAVFLAEFLNGDNSSISFENAANWKCPTGVSFVNATVPEASNYVYHIQAATAYTQFSFVERNDVTYYGRIVVDTKTSALWPTVYLPICTNMTFYDFRIGPYATLYNGNGGKTFSVRGKFTVYGDGFGNGVNIGVYYRNGIQQFEAGVLRGDEKAMIGSSSYTPTYSNGLVFVTAENYRGSVWFKNATAEDTFFTLGDTGDSALKAVTLGTNMQFRAYAATDRVKIGDLTFKNDGQFMPQGTADGAFSCVTVTNVLTLGATPVRVGVTHVAYPAKQENLQRYPVLKWPTAKAAGAYSADDFIVAEPASRRHVWTTWTEGDMTCFGVEVPAKAGLMLLFR